MISLKNIYKSYLENGKELKIFENLNLDIKEGTKNIILGSSGSGKSTFLNLISALDDVDRGEIWIDGINLAALKENDKTKFRREKIGFIFQFFNLIPTITVEENIFLPLELNQKLNKENQEYTLAILEKVGLIDRLKSMPDRLSGGEQQRVAIVRALAHKPKIIVADEPTGNLDKDTAQIIIQIINELCTLSKVTLVMATHDTNLCAIADQTWKVNNHELEPR